MKLVAAQTSNHPKQGQTLVVVALLVALAVSALGWWTNLRSVMYGALTLLMAGALFPFLALIALVAAVSCAAFVAALSGGGDVYVGAPEATGIAEAWPRLTRGYYRQLAKQRSPWFWGIPLGVVVGVLVLWGALAVWVVPGETQTMKILASARDDIERAERDSGKYPAPDAEGHYVRQGGVVVDGFGRPLHYRVTGRWKLASYVIRSSGFDGRSDDDDLCLAGGGKLSSVSRAAAALARMLEGRTDAPGFRDWLSTVRAARCSEPKE